MIINTDNKELRGKLVSKILSGLDFKISLPKIDEETGTLTVDVSVNGLSQEKIENAINELSEEDKENLRNDTDYLKESPANEKHLEKSINQMKSGQTVGRELEE